MMQFWKSFDVEFHGLTIWSNHISNFYPPYRELGISALSWQKNLLKNVMIKIEARFYGCMPFLTPTLF